MMDSKQNSILSFASNFIVGSFGNFDSLFSMAFQDFITHFTMRFIMHFITRFITYFEKLLVSFFKYEYLSHNY